MATHQALGAILVLGLMGLATGTQCQAQTDAVLPAGVKAVWDQDLAYREKTLTRERICINGLWRWQPVARSADEVPAGNWGYFKVPGPWPKTTWGRHNESQTAYPHPSWKDVDLSKTELAWYQREVVVPKEWAGRRIFVDAQYVNTTAVVYLDGSRAGEIKSRGGAVDLTAACQPGQRQTLSIFVSKPPNGRDFRGLCGDVYLDGVPQNERIADVKVDPSVRKWQITADTALASLNPGKHYMLRGELLEVRQSSGLSRRDPEDRGTDDGRVVKTIASPPFRAQDLQNGRFTFSQPWKPDKLWDTNTPQNKYDLKLSLLDAGGKVLDEFRKIRFGFREFWIDGRDLRLNGTRFFCYATPLDVGEVSAYGASYAGTCKMIYRFRSVGVNLAYTHNYSSVPGAHVSFEEIMQACDDLGMLVSLSQPQFGSYKWDTPDAEQTNGYAADAEYYVRQAQNHPSVVMYSTSHNATGRSQDQNPDLIDGIHNFWPDPEGKLMRVDQPGIKALRAEALVRRFDQSRPLYHHSSGNLSQMYTLNCYLNFVPIQERSDWFEHWATKGVKPLLLVEYGTPYLETFSWARTGNLPGYNPCFAAEWGAQFRGDAAYQLTSDEKGSPDKIHINFPNVAGVVAAHIMRNFPAFRTWGVTLYNDWNQHYTMFTARKGASNATCKVDWNDLQKPGFSPDFINTSRWDIGYEDSDWTPNAEGQAVIRCNQPVLAYIAGSPGRFTSQDHNFSLGENVEKQIIVINNSRRQVTCECAWSLESPQAPHPALSPGGRGQGEGGAAKVTVETGEQVRTPVHFTLPANLQPGRYQLTMTAKLDTGQTQDDVFNIDVMPPAPKPQVAAKVAVFDPKGETRKLLSDLGVQYSAAGPDEVRQSSGLSRRDPEDRGTADAPGCDILVIGKHALTLSEPKLDLARVRAGLKVIVFEQTTEVLEKRFGFRTQEYGLRQVFPRVPAGAGVLAGLTAENLQDWRGEGTTVPGRLSASMNDPSKYGLMDWCGFAAARAWRCGCQGTVATALIEKPTAGDFLPLLDGGFALQYAPLMEYREGTGMVLFCQLDLTGRTEREPAATRLAGNLLAHVSSWQPAPRRKLLYVGEAAGKTHLEQAALAPAEYEGGALTADQVLAVGPGGGRKLAAHAKDIDAWLKAGGRLLAIGLDQEEANAFLPFRVATKAARYVCGNFTLPATNSPFAGIAPADLYNRAPQELPLVVNGTASLGDGVLSAAGNGNVVFCQLVPWHVVYQDPDNMKSSNLKPNFRRFSFTVTRLLANMGVRADTALLQNMQTPLPASAMLEDVPEAVWLQAGENTLILPKLWKGLPLGAAAPPQDWETAGFDAGKWRDIKVPGRWQEQFKDLANQNGLFLYRVTFDVPAEMAAQDVTLVLGAVDDEDMTYVNGTFVGSLTQQTNPKDYWYAVRRYPLPKGLLKAGTNVLAVRNNDLRGTGGILASLLKRRGAGSTRWLTGMYLDKPEAMDDPYRYYCW